MLILAGFEGPRHLLSARPASRVGVCRSLATTDYVEAIFDHFECSLPKVQELRDSEIQEGINWTLIWLVRCAAGSSTRQPS
jgi:hypothetical protein